MTAASPPEAEGSTKDAAGSTRDATAIAQEAAASTPEKADASVKAEVSPETRSAAEGEPAAAAAAATQPKTEEGDTTEIPVVKANYDRDTSAPGQRKAVLMVCQVSNPLLPLS